MNNQNELNGRHRHHWSGVDRAKDVEALIDKVATVVELYNDNGRLVQLALYGRINSSQLRHLPRSHRQFNCRGAGSEPWRRRGVEMRILWVRIRAQAEI